MKLINAFTTARSFHIATRTILVVFALHCLLAIGAYFTFNLGVNRIENASQWWYSIAERPDYIGNSLHLDIVFLILLVTTPFLLGVCGLLIALNLWRRRGEMPNRQKIVGIIALLTALIMFPLLASPFGYAVGLWFFD